jgi:hypothetical protein
MSSLLWNLREDVRGKKRRQSTHRLKGIKWTLLKGDVDNFVYSVWYPMTEKKEVTWQTHCTTWCTTFTIKI